MIEMRCIWCNYLVVRLSDRTDEDVLLYWLGRFTEHIGKCEIARQYNGRNPRNNLYLVRGRDSA